MIVDDIDPEAEHFRIKGVKFHNEVIKGPGGSQVLAEDPFRSVVELFQRAAWF